MPQFSFGVLIILLPMLIATGCDSQLSINEFETAPAISENDDYADLETGHAVLDGQDGRLDLLATVETLPESGNRFIALGEPVAQVPRVTLRSAAVDILSLSVGDEASVSVFYNVDGSLGGPGLVQVTQVTANETSGLFTGCVRAENLAIPISGPSQIVRGGFSVTEQ